MSKYKNKKCTFDGLEFDSKREAQYYAELVILKSANDPAKRVMEINRQVSFELIPKQEGERSVKYIADFEVVYADRRIEVIDVKSEYTRKLPAYILKRKMMLHVHNIKVKEIY